MLFRLRRRRIPSAMCEQRNNTSCEHRQSRAAGRRMSEQKCCADCPISPGRLRCRGARLGAV